MKVDLQKLKEIAIKHGIPAVEEILIELAFPLVEEAVAASPNKVDDAVLAMLEPSMKAAVTSWLESIKA